MSELACLLAVYCYIPLASSRTFPIAAINKLSAIHVVQSCVSHSHSISLSIASAEWIHHMQLQRPIILPTHHNHNHHRIQTQPGCSNDQSHRQHRCGDAMARSSMPFPSLPPLAHVKSPPSPPYPQPSNHLLQTTTSPVSLVSLSRAHTLVFVS